MLAHAFKFVDRVIFRIGATNWRSQRAVQKLGAILIDQLDPLDGHVKYEITKSTCHPELVEGPR
jgi:N-acetyltransferase